MSATNQLQQNAQPGAYYLDQYTRFAIPFVQQGGGSNGFTVTFCFHKQGSVVMVETILSTNNTSNSAGLFRYDSTVTIPEQFRPGSDKFGTVLCDNNLGSTQVAAVFIQSNGYVYLYPATNEAFAAGSYVNGGGFTYFLNSI